MGLFLDPTERMILMDMAPEFALFFNKPCWNVGLHEGFSQFIDLGLHTAIEYVHWYSVEPRPGEYRWEALDKIVSEGQRTGMKIILAAHNYLPMWMPKDWFPWFSNLTENRGYLNPLCPAAMDYLDNFYRLLMARYPDCLVIQSNFLDGECLFHNTLCYFDPYSQRDYRAYAAILGEPGTITTSEDLQTIYPPIADTWIKMTAISYMTRIQRVLQEGKWKECWDSMQPLIGLQSRANANFAGDSIYRSWRIHFPESPIHLIQYTYFAHSQAYFDNITRWQNEGIKVIVEAQYCTGLPATAPLAIERKMRGQIIAPFHPFMDYTRLEPWMITNIVNAMQLWKEA